MKIKVGINGFGRMGRLCLRAAFDWQDVEFVHINDPAGDAATLAHLLTFDSVHGRWHYDAKHDGDSMIVAGKTIPCTRNKAIAETDWSGCDVVIEASGKMKSSAVLQAYLEQGVKRVVVTASPKMLTTPPPSAGPRRRRSRHVPVSLRLRRRSRRLARRRPGPRRDEWRSGSRPR